jgi:hypothetical protein
MNKVHEKMFKNELENIYHTVQQRNQKINSTFKGLLTRENRVRNLR